MAKSKQAQALAIKVARERRAAKGSLHRRKVATPNQQDSAREGPRSWTSAQRAQRDLVGIFGRKAKSSNGSLVTMLLALTERRM
jgi:hypothetical protein